MPENNPSKSTPDRVYKIAEFTEFQRFIALPGELRMEEFGFDLENDFAVKYKLSRDTLVDWKKYPEFWVGVKDLWKTWGKTRTPEVLRGLFKKAKRDGTAAEVMAWLKIIEDYADKSEIKASGLGELLDKLATKENPLIKDNGNK
jgi:hypothetical protein